MFVIGSLWRYMSPKCNRLWEKVCSQPLLQLFHDFHPVNDNTLTVFPQLHQTDLHWGGIYEQKLWLFDGGGIIRLAKVVQALRRGQIMQLLFETCPARMQMEL